MSEDAERTDLEELFASLGTAPWEWEGYQPRRRGPGISHIWHQSPIHRDEGYVFSDACAEAWDRLCDQSAGLEEWYVAHESTLGAPDVHTYLWLDDGIADKFTRRGGTLILRHPVEPVRAADDIPGAMAPLIIRLLRRRAELAGLPAPPAGGDP